MNNLTKLILVVAVILLGGCSSSPTPPPPCDVSGNSEVNVSFNYASFSSSNSIIPCNARRPINTSI